jgi:hypothetical protein
MGLQVSEKVEFSGARRIYIHAGGALEKSGQRNNDARSEMHLDHTRATSQYTSTEFRSAPIQRQLFCEREEFHSFRKRGTSIPIPHSNTYPSRVLTPQAVSPAYISQLPPTVKLPQRRSRRTLCIPYRQHPWSFAPSYQRTI